MLAHTSHQLSATVVDAPHPAALSHLGVLTVLSSTPPRPSDRKLHWAQHLNGLATKPGEKCGLVPVRKRHFFAISSSGYGFPCATYRKYDSAETLAFLEIIEKLLVSTSGTALSPSGVFGWGLC